MFVTTSPAPLPFVASSPEPRVTAPQPVKAPTFAKLLHQSQHQSPPQNPSPPRPAPPPTGAGQTAAADAAESASPTDDPNTATAGRTRTTTTDKARKPAPASTAKPGGEGSGKTEASTDDTEATASDAPALAHAMSHLVHPTSLPTAEALAATAGAAAAADPSDAALADATGAGTRADAVRAAGERHGDTDPAQADPAALLRAEAADEALTKHKDGAASGGEAKAAFTLPIDAGTTLLPTASAFAAHAATGTARNAEPAVTVAIATPVTAPEFPQALGVQLSVLAEGGIQHAELHLNPADMGPVSVQIEMNGNQAHIDFGADVAATRHAIEAGLPELASALRDAGFTLSGGGVSQHPRGGSEPGGGDARGGSRSGSIRADAIDGIASPPASARRQLTLGGLDLYA